MIADCREALSGKVYSLTAAQATQKVKAKGRALYEKLFRPLEAHLSGARRLLIVPDGALNYLPFETLISEEREDETARSGYLLERFAVSYAPSASALAALRRINRTAEEVAGFVAFGDPAYANAPAAVWDASRQSPIQLPWTRTEVNGIASLFAPAERRVYLGAKAAEKNATTETLGRARYVHFAAHGLIDERYPARSGIALSAADDATADGVLQMREIMRLRLRADLVTLSACRTGLGQLLDGEGLVGLTRAFLYAGADSVMVSLWGVNDSGTAALMKSFYEHLRQGQPKDEALRRAKLALLNGTRRAWRHPYFWASFVLVGEPR